MDILFVHKGDEMNWKKFMLCGLTGWCMEILFTSFEAFLHGDARLLGRTSVWMFPIYGMAAFISPIYIKIKHWPILLRGFLYGAAIMIGEFISGSILRFFHVCPWDYSDSFFNVKGLVRLDYYPLWVLAGLAFERLLCWQGSKIKKEQINH